MNMYKTIDRHELFALLAAGVLTPRLKWPVLPSSAIRTDC
jgi:hypothetical protein